MTVRSKSGYRGLTASQRIRAIASVASEDHGIQIEISTDKAGALEIAQALEVIADGGFERQIADAKADARRLLLHMRILASLLLVSAVVIAALMVRLGGAQ